MALFHTSRAANGTLPKKGNCSSRMPLADISNSWSSRSLFNEYELQVVSVTPHSRLKITNELFSELMQCKMDQAPIAHSNSNPSLTTIKTINKLADKHSEEFLHGVLYPWGIKVISDTFDSNALESLQKYTNYPNRLAFGLCLKTGFEHRRIMILVWSAKHAEDFTWMWRCGSGTRNRPRQTPAGRKG